MVTIIIIISIKYFILILASFMELTHNSMMR